MIERTYEVGRSSITLRFGDIVQSNAEVLVSSDDFLLSMGGGVSASLRRAGGARLAADASKLVPAEVGDVVVPADLIRQKVTQSKAYLCILAMRYGYVDPGTGLSMTELEYHQAVASAKPLHIFVMDDLAPILAGMVETNSEHYARLVEFKAHVMKAHTCKLFTTPADLARKAMEALRSGQS